MSRAESSNTVLEGKVFLKHRRLKLPVLIQFRGSRFGFGENFADFSPAISRDDPITQLTAKVSCRWRVFHDDLLLLVVEKSSATGQKLKGLSRPRLNCVNYLALMARQLTTFPIDEFSMGS